MSQLVGMGCKEVRRGGLLRRRWLVGVDEVLSSTYGDLFSFHHRHTVHDMAMTGYQ
jgi:hypothetical protein